MVSKDSHPWTLVVFIDANIPLRGLNRISNELLFVKIIFLKKVLSGNESDVGMPDTEVLQKFEDKLNDFPQANGLILTLDKNFWDDSNYDDNKNKIAILVIERGKRSGLKKKNKRVSAKKKNRNNRERKSNGSWHTHEIDRLIEILLFASRNFQKFKAQFTYQRKILKLYK